MSTELTADGLAELQRAVKASPSADFGIRSETGLLAVVGKDWLLALIAAATENATLNEEMDAWTRSQLRDRLVDLLHAVIQSAAMPGGLITPGPVTVAACSRVRDFVEGIVRRCHAAEAARDESLAALDTARAERDHSVKEHGEIALELVAMKRNWAADITKMDAAVEAARRDALEQAAADCRLVAVNYTGANYGDVERTVTQCIAAIRSRTAAGENGGLRS